MKLNLARLTAVNAAVLVLGACATLRAQNVTPNFGTSVPTATTDRYDPATWGLTNATHGRNDVLNIGINSTTDLANRPAAFQSTFYNTQGKDLGAHASGAWTLTSDLWVDASWGLGTYGNLRRTDMWGVAVDATKSVTDYLIIGFTNDPGSVPGAGLFRGWDEAGGAWVNFGNAVNYDAWNTLAIHFDDVADTFSYYVNGSLALTLADAGGSTGIGGDLMQAYNFNDPAVVPPGVAANSEYTALWSNTPALTSTPEPASLALLSTGLVGVAGFGIKRRRRNT